MTVAALPAPSRRATCDDASACSHVWEENWTWTGPGGTITWRRALRVSIVPGERIARDPIAENGGINLYSYLGNNPSNLIDPLGLAWESTQSQGIHYNDRKSGLGFGLSTDSSGRLVPVPLPGDRHSFDATKAQQILNDALADKSRSKDLLDMAKQNLNDPSYKDKARCQRILGGLTKGVSIAGIGAFLGTIAVTNDALAAYEKLRDNGRLSDVDKMTLIEAVGTSGVPGSAAAAVVLLDILQE